MEKLIREMLVQIGEDPNREGLAKTPERVARAWKDAGLDPATGEVFWRYPFKPNRMVINVPTPVVDGDFVYGVGSYGEMRGLELEAGRRLWESLEPVGEKARWAAAFIVRQGDRYIINNDRGELILADLEGCEDARLWVYQHHERWDGKGYPNGLGGEEVALPGRMLILAEVYDALLALGYDTTTGVGYNANTGAVEDLVKAGVIDPAKVVRTALSNAASIAALMLTTEALVTNLDKEDKDKQRIEGSVR